MKSLLFILFFISTYPISVFAANNTAEVLVYRNESMPWCGTIDGKDVGITVDILYEVTKQGGPTFTFKSLPWARAQLYVQKNIGTAIIPFTRTPTREAHHTWIIRLVPNQIRFTLAKQPAIKLAIPMPVTLESLKSFPVGVIHKSAIVPYLKESGFINISEVNTADQNAKKLALGRIAAMAESKWVDNYVWHQAGQSSADLIPGPNIGEALYIYLGAARNFPPKLTKQIREAMLKVEQSGALNKILNKWTHFE